MKPFDAPIFPQYREDITKPSLHNPDRPFEQKLYCYVRKGDYLIPVVRDYRSDNESDFNQVLSRNRDRFEQECDVLFDKYVITQDLIDNKLVFPDDTLV